eukprot:TCALIF_10811-PA protein Name:"Similar to DNTTIP2 Deoxynucleotidyltransferase terminal-interacting protein 2 (Bos taurus)" AED:0.20 eAED:0.20 QI:0/0/0/0.4/1/1/5/0/255
MFLAQSGGLDSLQSSPVTPANSLRADRFRQYWAQRAASAATASTRPVSTRPSESSPSASAVFSSSLETGIDESDVYVESRPGQHWASLVEKSHALALGDQKARAQLLTKAAGDEKQVIERPLGQRSRKKMNRLKREETKGAAWFHMKAPEITDETRRELEVLQMRSVLDPKRFYKKNDRADLPKYFQIGRVIDSPVDYYTDRTTKKDRKKSLVDQLMADAEFKKYNKRKYTQIIEEKSKLQRKYSGQTKRKKKSV